MILIDLILNFFIIGLFSFGGGYSSIAMVEEYAVEGRGYLTISDLNSIFAISEMTPGPFGLNCATFVGGMVDGFWGALLATIGFVLPSLIIVILLAYLYEKFKENKFVKNVTLILSTCIVANLISSAITILFTAINFDLKTALPFNSIDIKAFVLFLVGCVALIGIRDHKASPIALIIFSALIGIIIY